MKLLLYVGAFVMVASMYLVEVDDFTVHAIITGAMAGAVSHVSHVSHVLYVVYVVSDLDDAFGGVWQVSPASFYRAKRYMEHRRRA